MSNKIIYRKEKGSQLTSAEVDSNFKYLDQRIDKASQKDYFIHDAGYSKSDQQVTVNRGSKWLIGGEEISNAVAFDFAIERAEWANLRVDVIVANAQGQFEIIKGENNPDGYVIPRIVGNDLPYLYIYTSDAGIQTLGSDVAGDFISKLSTRWVQVNMKGKTIPIDINQRNIEIVGGNSFDEGVKNGMYGFEVDANFPDGFEVSIRNSRTDYITVLNNAITGGLSIKLYTLENYYLRPGEVIVFKYVKTENCFVVSGALDIRLSSQNVDDIIGLDSLNMFIESSKGHLLMFDDLRTTLTPTIQRYWKDMTNSAVGWQWFRESGKTQEDQDSDEIWSQGKTKRVLELVPEDFTLNVGETSITFTCQAIVEGQEISQTFKVN